MKCPAMNSVIGRRLIQQSNVYRVQFLILPVQAKTSHFICTPIALGLYVYHVCTRAKDSHVAITQHQSDTYRCADHRSLSTMGSRLVRPEYIYAHNHNLDSAKTSLLRSLSFFSEIATKDQWQLSKSSSP